MVCYWPNGLRSVCRLFHQHHPKGDILTLKARILTQKTAVELPTTINNPKKNKWCWTSLKAKRMPSISTPLPALAHSIPWPSGRDPVWPCQAHLHFILFLAPQWPQGPSYMRNFGKLWESRGKLMGKLAKIKINHKKCHARLSRGLMENGNVSPINTEKSVL